MNTRLRYRYRDGSNYKTEESVVIPGALDAERFSAAIATAARGAGVESTAFSPVDFGLIPAQEQLWTLFPQNEDDHIYNELISIELTDDPITVALPDAPTLLARAEHAAREGYRVAFAMAALDLDA